MSTPLLTPWRLRVYPRVLLAAMGVTLALAFLGGSGAHVVSGRLGGDFAEFYAAGRILRQGDGPRLYDPAVQQAAQADLMPGAPRAYVPFAYPPQFALPYALLGFLPYRSAFAVHLAVMAALLYGAVWLACRDLAWARPFVAAVFCATVFFYPMLRALLGGQNTPLTLALCLLAWTLERRGWQVPAGLVLAALCYKPQFGLGLLGLYCVAGRLRLVSAGGAALAGIALTDTALCGPGWFAAWITHANGVVATSLGLEGDKAVSFLGVCRHLLRTVPDTALALGLGLSLATAAILVRMFWRQRGRDIPLSLLAPAVTGLLLIAPHAYFYDAGLLFLPALVLLDAPYPHAPSLILGVWLVGILQVVAGRWGVSPLFPATMLLFSLAAQKVEPA